MKIIEEKKDLFSVNFKEYTSAHCISSDCKMSAGIAVPMKKKFKLYEMKENVEKEKLESPTCVYYNGVFNLITKRLYFSKPSYESMESALIEMKNLTQIYGMKKIVMPKIGSGLDKLSWPKVKKIIEKVFENTNVEFLVCYL
jgi:O-acetyl-ADP-ribose deacetylase (regulator of RNase III)